MIFDNITLPDVFSGFGFGPIASYASHGCPQGTESIFSNIKLIEDTSTNFSDLVRSTAWKYKDSQKIIVNVDNDGVTDFGDNGKLGSTLYYLMKNNTSYIGWGINNNINIGGYTTVKDQANGFIARNEGNGTFINRSDPNYSTLDQGVNAIAAYIAGQNDSLKNIDKPNLLTSISGNGNVTCNTKDTTTSKGNPIGAYKWKTLDIVSGQWKDEASNTNSASLTFAQNTYNMVGLSIQDSVTGEWSDYAYSYIATVSNAEPISQFTVDKNTLMPDCSVAALKTGTVVTAVDSSYIPNGDAIAAYEWSVLDAGLKPITALGKSYTSSNIPSSLQFDFAGQPAGTYTIRLRTQNSSGAWSSYYTQQVTIYKESSNITISTTNNTSGINIYTGSTAIPFTISSAGGNISAYRLINIPKNGNNNIGDWTNVDAASISKSQTISNTNCDEYVQAIDAAGNSKTQFLGTYYLPIAVTAAYDGTNTAYTSNTATNKNVTLTINNTGIEYSTDGGKSFTPYTSPITASAYGNYIFRYTNDSNSSNYASIVTNIYESFQGKVSGVSDQAKYAAAVTPVLENATATIAKDNNSPTEFTSNTQISEDGKYSLTATDQYGNTQTYNFIIDKVNPIISVTGNPTDWTNNDVTLSINNIVGISGINSLTVQKDNGDAVDITGQTSYKVSENESYVFKATNGVSQEAVATVNVTKIDKTIPELSVDSVKSDNNNYVYSSQIPNEKDVTINLSNPNNVASDVVYYSSANGTDWKPISGNTFTIDDTNNGTVNYQFKAVSGSGLESAVSNQVPVYIVKPYFTNDILVTTETSDGKTNSGEWTNKNITFTVSKGINAEAFSKYQYTTTPSDADSWKDMTGVGLNTLTVSDDQSSKYYFRVVSKGQSVGQATEGTSVNVDKTAPADVTIKFKNNSFKQFINNISFGLFYNDNVDVSLSADGNISGIDHYEYQIVNTGKNESYNENGTWEEGDSFSISPQFKGVIYARAVDKAGNISAVVSSDGLVTDNIQPTSPKITAAANGNEYKGDWTSKDIEVQLSDSSALSGINHYEYKIGANGTWSALPLQNGNTDATSGKVINNKLVISQNMNDTYYLRAVSNSGITGTEGSLVIKRDNIIPETKVSSSGVINNWTKDPVTFTLDNGNTQNIAPVTYWVKVGNSDWSQIQSNVYTINNNVNTTYQFKTISAAGVENVSDTVYSVKLDKTAPSINITGNPETWSKDDVTLAIQANTDISGIASITVSKDGGTPEDITGKDGYTVSSNGNYVFKLVNGANQIVTKTVNVTKIDKRSLAAPTNPVQDDTKNTFGWTNVDGYPNITDYEYSIDNGTTWTIATANPQTIPDKTYDKGTIQVRVKADSDTGKPAGQALCSTAAYSKTPVAVTGSLIDGNSNNQISNVSAVVTADSQGNNIVSVNAAQAVAVKQADGSVSSLGDLSKITVSSTAGASISVSDDGTIKLNNLANGTDTTFDITYDLGNGQKIIIGKLEVKISSNGAVSLQSTLIDPYGTITDSATGKPVAGVKVTLYYADTARNRAAGKTPGTIVPLPEIIGFKPNNNHNSQVSDALGAYGFMVFPYTDYYIVAEKDGYDKYISPTISVETDIVKFDISFTKTAAATVTLPKTGSPIDMEVFIIMGILLMAAGAVVLNKGFSVKKD